MQSLGLLVSIALAALRVPGPLSTRIASYRIDAALDEARREVTGSETITWRNDGTAPTATIPLHLYMNAFANDASTFLREMERPDRPAVPDRKWGAIDVRDLVVKLGGVTLAARLDVPRSGDRTIAMIALERAIAPGETVTLSLAFTTRLPEILARTGVHAGFYAVAQWYPSIAVYECTPTCAWSAAQHHAMSEFYADFGTYDVTLDLPSALGVAATGVRTSAEVHGARQRMTWRAEDVHDFVFAADAGFVEHAVDVDDGSGLPPVRVVIVGERGAAANVPRHLAAARAGLRELGARLGWYPYSQLTIVQPPQGAGGASGMEYPTLFFTLDAPLPPADYDLELTTVHELAHQWFQGMLASDEVHEAWLDEGLTELATSWVLATITPPVALLYSMLGHELTYEDTERATLQRGSPDAIDVPAYAFSSETAYEQMSYRKPSLLLATLAARLGDVDFRRRLHAYADANRFRHPHRADFVAAFADAPRPLRTLLDDALGKGGTLDYAVTHVTSKPVYPTEGLVDGGEVSDPPRSGAWHSTIVVERVGEYALPVTVRARFADGSERDTLVELGADERWRRVELDGPSQLVEARLHPLHDTPLDTNTLDDGLRVEVDPTPRHSIVASLELVIALVLSWIAR